MNQNIAANSNNLGKKINPDQLDQLVEAILAGKYSWACVLLLRFAGYNPLHYIPYRTYNRLLKENHINTTSTGQNENLKITKLSSNQRSDSNASLSLLKQN